jgi:hypothetical protein
MRGGGAEAGDDGKTAGMPRPTTGGAAMRLVSASDAVPLGDGRYTVNVMLSEGGAQVPVKLTLALGDLPRAAKAAKSGGGGALAISMLSLLIAIATAAFVAAAYLGMLPPRGSAPDSSGTAVESSSSEREPG